MSDLGRVERAVRPLWGRVQAPADKSITHRALLLAAVAQGRSRIRRPSPAGDCQATLGVLRALGVPLEADDGGAALLIEGQGLRGLREPTDALDCVRSGTTMRLLAGLLAGQPGLFLLRGDAQLVRRPMGRVVQPLRVMGARLWGRGGDRYPPLAVLGGPLDGAVHQLPLASAQVKSCLLLAGLLAEGRTAVHSPAESRDHTERMLASMGAPLAVDGLTASLDGPAEALSPLDLAVPGDFSSAAFLAAAAALVPGSQVTVAEVGLNPTRLGLLDVLEQMGVPVAVANPRLAGGEPVGDLTVGWGALQGMEVAGPLIPRLIDELPVLAVVATQAQGETLVRDAEELRHKESDRIAVTVQELRKLGGQIEERPDGFVVFGPTPLSGAVVQSHGDHRLAMALAVAGLVAQGETLIDGFGCTADSFPGFPDLLAQLCQPAGERP
ncbi:MAG: 3-phosphoshikimate 1-carboxyvinyltransferase [Chloroflexi bacterium]|nr:3-phosphoshikimate 1-carboxyvinyltransferase [Chloroflexota bacterium]